MLNYSKYNSCGNDFIIIDDRQGKFLNQSSDSCFSIRTQLYIQSLCNRDNGIGADGLILLQLSQQPNSLYHMVYFNSDGLVSSFCGNGSMCCAHFASSLGIAGKQSICYGTFDTNTGLFSFEVNFQTNKAQVSLVDVKNIKIDPHGIFVDTGSPHYVVFKEQINNIDVNKEGAEIRYSRRFEQKGTNVTFVSCNNQNISIRTYERGVEAETLSCGTGAVAAALCASLKNLILDSQVSVKTQGGYLKVSFNRESDIFSNIYLQSIVEKNFEGILPTI